MSHAAEFRECNCILIKGVLSKEKSKSRVKKRTTEKTNLEKLLRQSDPDPVLIKIPARPVLGEN